MAARLCGYAGDRAVLYAAVVEFIHTATLVHDDIIDDSDAAARPAGRALAVGQRHHGAARRLPLHQVDGDGADAGLARHRPAALRRHAADDRGRAVPAHEERRRRHHRGRALRHHPPQDRLPVRRLRADRRHARRASRPSSSAALREYGFNLGIAFQLVDDLLDFTGRRGGARQAGRRRPARGQGHAAGHPPAAAAAAPSAATLVRDVVRDRDADARAVGDDRRGAAAPSTGSIDYALRRAAELRRGAPSRQPRACSRRAPSATRCMALPDYVLARDR